MSIQTFQTKWSDLNNIDSPKKIDEKSLFVEFGEQPVTQRQLNLYYYFLFIKNIIEEKRFKDFLEIGCGRGTMSLFLKGYLGKEMTLLDNEAEAINLAKEEFGKRNLAANFYQGDALKMPFLEEEFDTVVSIGLAEHVDDINRLFSEQLRVLKKGGVMISLNVPKKFSIQILNIIFRFFKKVLGEYKESVKSDYYRNTLQASDYKKIAKDVGFKDIQLIHVCPFPIFTPLDISLDKKITKIYKLILNLRSIFQKYPYKTNSLIAQAHFLVGYKK